MAVQTNPQMNLQLGRPKAKVSLPERTEVETIAALAELMLQVWEMNRSINNPLEDRNDE